MDKCYFVLLENVEKGKKIKKATCKLCDGVNLAYVRGTTKLHNHLESKHPSSVAESSGKEAGKKQLTLSDCKKCSPEWAKNIIAWVAKYTPIHGGGFQQLLHYIVYTLRHVNIQSLKTSIRCSPN